MAAKPAMVMGVTAASLLPQIITSASPRRMAAAPSPTACAPVAQAETTARLGPRRPKRIDIAPRRRVREQHGNEKRAQPAGSARGHHGELGFQRLDAADAGAHKDAHAVCVFRAYTQSRVVYGLLGPPRPHIA